MNEVGNKDVQESKNQWVSENLWGWKWSWISLVIILFGFLLLLIRGPQVESEDVEGIQDIIQTEINDGGNAIDSSIAP